MTLTVTPPADLPVDGDPIVDVEAFVEGQLIGGFRKIFRPPVPVHRPRDPVYAESEIGVDPYPVIPGQPTLLSVEVFNPTDTDRFVTVTFSIAHFGIGLPFSPANIAPNPIRVFVPKFGAARGHVIWTPPNWRGKFCVRVTLEMPGHEPIWSQRNIDVGEPLRPGVPHAMTFLVGGWPHTEPVTVTLGLRVHRDGWGVALSQDVLPNVRAGPAGECDVDRHAAEGAELGTGEPIVDVEAFVEGELIGGFRKLDRPPVPIHKPHEKGYAESEIMIEPYPPQEGVDYHRQHRGPECQRRDADRQSGVRLGGLRDGHPLHDDGDGAVHPFGDAGPGDDADGKRDVDADASRSSVRADLAQRPRRRVRTAAQPA